MFKNENSTSATTSEDVNSYNNIQLYHHNDTVTNSGSTSIPFQYGYTSYNGKENSSNSSNHSNLADDESLRKHIHQSESDYNDAANSLIGFFNHIQRVGSQEDLVDYITGVQRTVDACGGRVEDSSDYSSHSGDDAVNVSSSNIEGDMDDYEMTMSTHNADGNNRGDNYLVRSKIDCDKSDGISQSQRTLHTWSNS